MSLKDIILPSMQNKTCQCRYVGDTLLWTIIARLVSITVSCCKNLKAAATLLVLKLNLGIVSDFGTRAL